MGFVVDIDWVRYIHPTSIVVDKLDGRPREDQRANKVSIRLFDEDLTAVRFHLSEVAKRR